jgi:hypothetical protein
VMKRAGLGATLLDRLAVGLAVRPVLRAFRLRYGRLRP